MWSRGHWCKVNFRCLVRMESGNGIKVLIGSSEYGNYTVWRANLEFIFLPPFTM
jgi:hypothetical protein